MVGPLNPKPGSPDPRPSGRDPADGGRPYSRRAPARRLLRRAAELRTRFSSVQPEAGPAGPQQQPLAVGTGQVKVGLILPLSAAGNAGVAAQSMKNAAEMALAEFQNPNIQLLIKDDGGSPQGAQQGTQQALDEGAEIILGPLFAPSVPATAQLTRARGVSVIAFSTDSSVAGRGVYLLSFLPESDVNRIVDYAASIGKTILRGAVARQCLWQCGGGRVQAGGRPQGGRIVAFEKYGADRAARGAHGGAVARLRPMRCSSPTTAIRWWRRRTR